MRFPDYLGETRQGGGPGGGQGFFTMGPPRAACRQKAYCATFIAEQAIIPHKARLICKASGMGCSPMFQVRAVRILRSKGEFRFLMRNSRRSEMTRRARPRDYSGNEIDATGLVLTLLGKPRLPQC
jgi:hypothetical protein